MSRMLFEDSSVSLGSETVSMTMQAEIEQMTPEEAIASGLFEAPDEPGMIRVPVTIHVTVTPKLAAAIEQAEAPPPAE